MAELHQIGEPHREWQSLKPCPSRADNGEIARSGRQNHDVASRLIEIDGFFSFRYLSGLGDEKMHDSVLGRQNLCDTLAVKTSQPDDNEAALPVFIRCPWSVVIVIEP